MLLSVSDYLNGSKGNTRHKQYSDERGCYLHPAKTMLFGMDFLIKFLPCSIHIDRFVCLTLATAALGCYHQAVGLAGIFITMDDVQDFLLGVCIGVVEHFQ